MNRTLTVKTAFTIVLISILLAFAAGSGITYFGTRYLPDHNPQHLTYISLFAGQGFMIIPLLIFLINRKETIVHRLRIRPVSRLTIGATILISLGVITLSDEIDRLINIIVPQSNQLSEIAELLSPDSVGSAFFLFFSIIIFAPLGEELLFRGFLQKFLEESWKDITRAVLVTSMFFAIVHLNPYWIIQIYLLGMVLGYLAWRTDSVIPGLILHGLNNGIALIVNNAGATIDEFYSWQGHVSPVWLLLAVIFIILGFKILHSVTTTEDPS